MLRLANPWFDPVVHYIVPYSLMTVSPVYAAVLPAAVHSPIDIDTPDVRTALVEAGSLLGYRPGTRFGR